MPFAVRELRSLLDDSRDHVELPRSVFGLDGTPRRLEALLGSPGLRLHDPRVDHDRLTISGTCPHRGTAVHVVFESDGEDVTGAQVHAVLTEDELDEDLAALVRAGFTEPRVIVATGSAVVGHRERHALTLGSDEGGFRVELTAPADGSQPFTAQDVDPVPLHALAASLGMADPPALPEPALDGATVLTAHTGPDGALVTGSGDLGRAAVAHTGDGSTLLLVAEGGGDWQVLHADRDLSEKEVREAAARLESVAGAPRLSRTGRLGQGSWLALPADPDGTSELLPLRARARRPADPQQRDGLGRPLPREVPERRSRARLRANRARRHVVAGREGFLLVDRGGRGSRIGVSGRTVTPLEFTPGYSNGIVSISYSKPPLRIAGALTTRDIDDPSYKRVFGGAVTIDAKTLAGSGAAAFFEPESGAEPSFFAYGALNARKAIGPPPFQIRGIAAGMGWNSRIRVPTDAGEVPDFPLVRALSDPGAIGDTEGDPVAILEDLTGGDASWITPAEDELWIAAGMAFSSFELLKGEAVMVLQTGSDLALALLGRGGMSFPAESERKIASIELAVSAVFKPLGGELVMSSQLTGDSYVLDPSCKVTGGSALAVWFGDHPSAGDFVYTVGGYHRDYEKNLPAHYPRVPRLGLEWGLGSTVSITGQSYFALTSGAAMAGGLLAVRFHSGPVKAWLDAWVDALVRWKPFHFDVGIGVYIGVQASVKLLFVRVTITVEVGADIRVWGPPTGGQAKIKLWFVSFTIDFGASRDGGPSTVDWRGFQEMLPPPEHTARIIAGPGLMSEQRDTAGTRDERGPAWQVSAAGFTFRTDSALPLRELYLDEDTTEPAHSSDALRIRPMDRSNLTSVHRVELERDDSPEALSEWEDTPLRGAVPAALYGPGDGSALPAPGDQVVADQLTGVELTSPPVTHGTSTGYISEKALAHTTLVPDGPQPLDPQAPPDGPVPAYREGTVAAIRDTVASATRAERDALADALTGLGFDLGDRDAELPGYAREAAVAFTREPMLVPVG